MKKLKLFYVPLLVVLLSGCTATYRVNIDKDSVEEILTFAETKEELLTFSTSVYTYLEEELQSVKDEGIYNSYTMSVDDDSNYGYGIGTRQYSNLENYKNSSIILTEMFKDISITQNENIMTIIMTPNDSFKYFEDSTLYASLLEQVDIEIATLYDVIYNNSDDNLNGVYTWTIKKGEALKEIRISYNTEVKILDAIPIELWIIGGIPLIITIIVLYIYIRYKKNSR